MKDAHPASSVAGLLARLIPVPVVTASSGRMRRDDPGGGSLEFEDFCASTGLPFDPVETSRGDSEDDPTRMRKPAIHPNGGVRYTRLSPCCPIGEIMA